MNVWVRVGGVLVRGGQRATARASRACSQVSSTMHDQQGVNGTRLASLLSPQSRAPVLVQRFNLSMSCRKASAPRESSSNGSSNGSAAASGTHALRCWKCGAERDASSLFFCAQCNAVQPVRPGLNYFDILSLYVTMRRHCCFLPRLNQGEPQLGGTTMQKRC